MTDVKTFDQWIELWKTSGMFCRPLWVKEGTLSIYVKCHHLMGNVVGISNIVNKHKYRGKGHLKLFLSRVELQVPLAFTEVQNLRLASMLVARGWSGFYDPDGLHIPCIASPLAMERHGDTLHTRARSARWKPLDNDIITGQIADHHEAVIQKYAALS